MPGRSLRVGGIPFSSRRGRDPGGPGQPWPLSLAASAPYSRARRGRAWGALSCTEVVLPAACPPGSRGTGRPLRLRLPPGEAAQDPMARVAGRPGIRVPAESPCGPPRWLGLPPRGASFEAATKGGAVQQSGSASISFSEVPSSLAGRRAGALVRKKRFLYVSTEVSRSRYFFTGWFRPLPPPFPTTSPRPPSDLSEFAPPRGSQPGGAGQVEVGRRTPVPSPSAP